MTLKPLEGFQHFTTHHCVTGSMRHVYTHNGYPISEELLLGLGAGVSFSYWHFKGQTPFMGGRGGVRPPLMEEVAGQRTGVSVAYHTTSSARKAERTLLEQLDAGQPVMLQCDMGFLPYFDFGGTDYHFGGHIIVVCGYDPDSLCVLVADRDEELHPVTMDQLAQARGSTYKPFPPKHLWYIFDFSNKRPPLPEEVRRAILEQADAMLEPPIRNIGVQGIRKAAKELLKWPKLMDEEELRFALFNAHIFIHAEGGTGGGIFRYMFSRFLREAADIAGLERLQESVNAFQHIGDRWQEVGELFKAGWKADDPATTLQLTRAPLLAIADMEEAAWMELRKRVRPALNHAQTE